MYEDVPSSNIPNKTILNELVNENVIPLFLNKILKGQSLLPFFYKDGTKVRYVKKIQWKIV